MTNDQVDQLIDNLTKMIDEGIRKSKYSTYDEWDGAVTDVVESWVNKYNLLKIESLILEHGERLNQLDKQMSNLLDFLRLFTEYNNYPVFQRLFEDEGSDRV